MHDFCVPAMNEHKKATIECVYIAICKQNNFIKEQFIHTCLSYVLY